MSAELTKAANMLARWRAWFAGWQLGTRLKDDPECNAVRDHREVTLMLRAEVNALIGLLVSNGTFTLAEWDKALTSELIQMDADMSERFPGVASTDIGLVYTHEAAETMRKMNFKP